ncbi:RagB/SusD family nutrient uptake outer membrane protein [Salinimicrobium sp. TIG7-5_MAKvit]|uniref:RagB/SusD family nutrient uptake outer membrane protein n=1 Tax=Salinimicrobium sp. TIG7-5_MAKvit TaxID=3121289 RepID=UPI003C6DDD9F
MKIKYLFVLALGLGILGSCTEEDLNPTLGQDKSIETSINTVNDLQAVLIGAYDRLSETESFGRDIIILGEVFSDNTYSNANSNRFVREAEMDLLVTTTTAETLWQQMYRVIGSANVVIAAEGIEGEQAAIDIIKGQAYALRGLAHFVLVQFYGQQHVNDGGLNALGVPYVTSFRDNDNLFPPRNTVSEVRDLVYADLETAQDLLPAGAGTSSEFISNLAAVALEARVANYFGDFPRSLTAAKTVIDSGAFAVVSEDGFLASFGTDGGVNKIFEVAFTATDNPGINGLANIYQAGSYGDVVALPNLAAIYSEDDIRGVHAYDPDIAQSSPDYVAPETVIGVTPTGTYRNIGKYPSTAPYEDNVPLIRYEEIVLIYAEALLETGSPAEALTWLNLIPENRGADLFTVASKDNILLERRKELAFEGFRFHDLVRTGKDIPLPDPLLQTHGGPDYGSYNLALPIPAAEADANANVPQNFGYGN